MEKKRRLSILVEGGVMIALATVLSMIKLLDMPYGGSITALSMLPILVFAYRHGLKWGLLAGFADGLIQLILGTSAIAGISWQATVCAVLFDYLLAFTVLAAAALFRGRRWGFVAGVMLGIFLRFVCHYITGVAIWSVYAPEGQSVWLYSLLYNGGYMGVEFVTHTVAALLLSGTALKRYLK